jgi:membrane associated rhomboid family serine protease
VPLAVLFSLITAAFAGIAVYSATASQWPIAVASGALAAWMGSLAYSALRKTRV